MTVEEVGTFVWQVDDKVVFVHGDHDTQDYHYMAVDAWYEMGKPKTVKIIIEPLGGEDAAE